MPGSSEAGPLLRHAIEVVADGVPRFNSDHILYLKCLVSSSNNAACNPQYALWVFHRFPKQGPFHPASG